MSSTLVMKEPDWDNLMRRIRDDKCTPFIGSGACIPVLPTGGKAAQTWATRHSYPLEDTTNLSRVAQFMAIQTDPVSPKEAFQQDFLSNIQYPDFMTPMDPHGVLAKLPLSFYITTNYDDLMMRALQAHGKQPRREVARWNHDLQKDLRGTPSVFDDPTFVPSPQTPVVFHLHGYDIMPESFVLTEDDYIDFLVNLAQDKDTVLPPVIQGALKNTLLFIGYSLADINFRVLFRGIRASVSNYHRGSFTVQFPKPAQTPAQDYLENYFKYMENIKVVWSEAATFVHDLNDRWGRFNQP